MLTFLLLDVIWNSESKSTNNITSMHWIKLTGNWQIKQKEELNIQYKQEYFWTTYDILIGNLLILLCSHILLTVVRTVSRILAKNSFCTSQMKDSVTVTAAFGFVRLDEFVWDELLVLTVNLRESHKKLGESREEF